MSKATSKILSLLLAVCLTLGGLAVMPVTAYAATATDLQNTGDLTLDTPGLYNISTANDGAVITVAADGIGLTGTHGNLSVVIDAGVTLTLKDADITGTIADNPIRAGGMGCGLVLIGDNTATGPNKLAGVGVPAATSLAITGPGKLTATGNNGGAGIGGNQGLPSGDITINHATIIAAGTNGGAGIGGGGGNAAGGASGSITITNSYVEAVSGTAAIDLCGGAGIGGGGAGVGGGSTNNSSGGTGSTITITGGKLVSDSVGGTGGTSGTTGGNGALCGNGGGAGTNNSNGAEVAVDGGSSATADGPAVDLTGRPDANDAGYPSLPSIATGPASQTVTAGRDATFTVSASGGTAPLTYQWQLNGADITDGGVYSGATTDTLTLTSVAIADSGKQYRCVVTDFVWHEAISNAATLTVDAAPVDLSVSPRTLNLDLNGNPTGRLTISLGQSGNQAAGADLTSYDTSMISLSQTSVTTDAAITVTGLSTGSTTIAIGFSGGDLATPANIPVTVNVTDSTQQTIYHTVTFDLAGGTRTGGGELVQSVPDGGAATAPTASRSGYTFGGWDKSFSNVTTDMTVTAQWTQNSTGGGSSGDSGSDSAKSGVDYTAAPAFKWYTKTELEAAIRSGPPARTRYSGSAGVKAGLWKLFGQSPYIHDTTADGAVQVRVQFTNPSAITTDVLLSGRVEGDAINSIKGIFEKWFKNKVRVIHLEQQGAWGQPVQIAARVDLSGMDTENLCFYSYDKKANSYKRIEKPAYWIDKNGYLRFTTEYAGEIIISEGALERK